MVPLVDFEQNSYEKKFDDGSIGIFGPVVLLTVFPTRPLCFAIAPLAESTPRKGTQASPDPDRA